MNSTIYAQIHIYNLKLRNRETVKWSAADTTFPSSKSWILEMLNRPNGLTVFTILPFLPEFPTWTKSFNWNSTLFDIFDIFQVRVYTKKDNCKRRTVQLLPSDSPWFINMHIYFNTCWICLLILWGLKHNN